MKPGPRRSRGSRRCRLFAGVSPDALKPLAAAMRERPLAAGELLCGRGDPGDRLFVVIEGRLRVSVVTAEGRELSMRIVGAGEMAGEIAAFDGGPRTTDMTAIAPSRVSALAVGSVFRGARPASANLAATR